jgi:hypothetical protein
MTDQGFEAGTMMDGPHTKRTLRLLLRYGIKARAEVASGQKTAAEVLRELKGMKRALEKSKGVDITEKELDEWLPTLTVYRGFIRRLLTREVACNGARLRIFGMSWI